MYIRTDGSEPHPLLGFHYYQMWKLCNLFDNIEKGKPYLEKAQAILRVYFGSVIDRGFKIKNLEAIF